MILKDYYDKKIGDMTAREFIGFLDYLEKRRESSPPEWITVKEACELMQITRRTFERNYLNTKRVESRKFGARREVKRESIYKQIEA